MPLGCLAVSLQGVVGSATVCVLGDMADNGLGTLTRFTTLSYSLCTLGLVRALKS